MSDRPGDDGSSEGLPPQQEGPPPPQWAPPPPQQWGPPDPQQWGPPPPPRGQAPPGEWPSQQPWGSPAQWGPPPLRWGPPLPRWGPPPQWGPPLPAAPVVPPLPPYPHPEPREYHQMLRTWTYAGWRPVVGVLLVAVGMVLVAPIVLLPVLLVGVAIEGGPFEESFESAVTFQAVTPAALLYLNLTLGSLILVTWFVMRVLHRMRPRWLTSVAPKMRWKFLSACLGLAVVALVAQVVVSMLLPGAQEGDVSQQMNELTRTTLALALIVLFTTPFQAAGEEYVFRGYLLQAVGSFWSFPSVPAWVSRWVAILVTAGLFAIAHGVQNFPLFFDRFMFGLITGWLVVRTGGLEAGIAMHVLNNYLAFGFALLFADLTESLTVSEVGWGNIPLTLTQAGVYAVLVVLVARKMGLENRTRPPVTAERRPDRVSV